MYLSPIFYPVSIMPEQYRPFMQLSPLTTTVEQVRAVMMWGKVLDWQAWGISMGWACSLHGWGLRGSRRLAGVR